MGTSDIAAMIGLERQKQLLGCGEDSSACLTRAQRRAGCSTDGGVLRVNWR